MTGRGGAAAARAPASGPRRNASRPILMVVVAAAVAASVTAGLSLTGNNRGHHSAPRQRAALASQTKRKAAGGKSSSGVTLLAALRGATARYASPDGARTGSVPGRWYGARSILPVIATRPGWLRVRLAQRPDGSTAWIPDGATVQLLSTPYRIVVDLATTRLILYSHNRELLSAPAGVGTTTDPTPPGNYFVAFFEAPPAPGYGAFVMVTSAHSEAINDWEGSGDAVIGIHGPLGDAALIGDDGARISHGCIRLKDNALLRLRVVPAGTPIDIIG
jgi:lipoprotein-anchoring transpeptidase ErfK/SrfK